MVTILTVSVSLFWYGKRRRKSPVTDDVEHGFGTGPRVIGQSVVRRTAQWLMTVLRTDVADVQIAVRQDAEPVA